MIDWYYSDDTCPSDELVDKFADSKFGIDKWSSFAREIIQNSLDAQADENIPVEVEFDLNKDLRLTDIPGGERIKEILGFCENAATNKQTKSSYQRGLEVLAKEYVYCLKISDRNTNGVKTGRDEAWGAFVYDEGKSVKQRPGSAGSHGVGKKVPFIISSCNTVFYATKNRYKNDDNEEISDCLFQGKTTLISWTDKDGRRKNSKGWYGDIVENTDDYKNKILPINSQTVDSIHPYFLRTMDFGTDVIIVGVNIYNNEEQVKTQIISAVLENFFVAILNNKLVVKVFGEEINASTFNKMMSKFYSVASDTKNGLEGCLRVYQGDPDKTVKICDKHGIELGCVDIFFGVGNEHNKKYYTIVRSHGMRIVDFRVNRANVPFTSVVVINGKELNALLSSLENAAHDNFITYDENMEIDQNAVYALEEIKKSVSEYIVAMTEIDKQSGQEIDGLNNIISIPGIISSVKKNSSIPQIKPNKVSRKGKGKKSKDYDEGRTAGGGGTGKPKKPGKRGPSKKGGELESVLYDAFELEPVFMKTDDEYIIKLAVLDDLTNAEISIYSVNAEGKNDDSIIDYIENIYVDGVSRKVVKGKITGLNFKKGHICKMQIKLKKNITYQLGANVYVKEEGKNE